MNASNEFGVKVRTHGSAMVSSDETPRCLRRLRRRSSGRLCSGPKRMVSVCQFRTHAPQQTTAGLLDHSIRGGEQRRRDVEAQRFGGRQISNLFTHGISLSEILRSVKEIRAWLPEADLSNLRLHPASHRVIEIEQPEGRTDKRGQFVLPVSPPEQNADALFEQAQAAKETGDLAEAERLYRVVMKCDPVDAAPPFNLGNMLRASGRKVEAEAAFRAATRADPMFAEAWYNLSDLLDEKGRPEAAIDCLRSALRASPDYADAMFNLALLLQRSNKHAEAAEYWRRYLANDTQSEWAARARRSLKILRNATTTLLIAAVFQVAACNALPRPWRGSQRVFLRSGLGTRGGAGRRAKRAPSGFPERILSLVERL
jgi:tetratricopeptide (TPR) repeat protein